MKRKVMSLSHNDHEGAGKDNNDGSIELVEQVPPEPLHH